MSETDTLQDRRELKSEFRDGDRPDQNDFASLIDSSFNQLSDQLFAKDKRLGIGVEQPAAPLDVAGASESVRQSIITTDGSNSTFRIAHPNTNVVAIGGDKESTLEIGDFESNGASFDPKMTITSKGRVGIATQAPEHKLHVNGSAKIENKLYLGDCQLECVNGRLLLVYNGVTYTVKMERGGGGSNKNKLFWALIITGLVLLTAILLLIILELV
jgi:hypothetical protein